MEIESSPATQTSILHPSTAFSSLPKVRGNTAFSLLILCLFNTLFLCAQIAPTGTDVLRSALTDEAYARQLQDTAFFQTAPLRIPRLEELEFRTETHEFDPQLQEYALRFKFNSGRQIRVQDQINDKEQQLRYHAGRAYLEEVLFGRYQLLVELWYQRRLLALSATRAPWYRDRERLIRERIAERGERSYDDLLKLEDDRLNDRRNRLSATQRLTAVRDLIGTWTGNSVDTVYLTGWPSIDELAAQWQAWQTDTLILPWAVHRQRLRTELVALELAAEEAEQRNRLNFFQLRYQGDDNNPAFTEEVTLGVGVTLPFRSARSVKNQYLELERREEAREATERTERWVARLAAAETRLADQLDRCLQLREAYEEYTTQFAPDRLAATGVTSPELLLRAQEGLFYREELLLEQKYRLYEEYLEVLLLSGRMSAVPYRNWLTGGGVRM